MKYNRLELETAGVDVLLIGEASQADELAIAAAGSRCRVTRAGDVSQALAVLQHEDSSANPMVTELIVIVQNWPGHFSRVDVERLRAAAPLARICGLLGSWCEGEVRSGKPWPGAIRCYWHQWPARFQQAIAEMADGRRSIWSLPPTASIEEQLLAAVPFEPPRRHGLLAIIAENADTAATLADCSQMRGYKTAVLRSPRGGQISGAVAALWDTRPEAVADPATVGEVQAAVDGAPLIALVNFPRPELVTLAKAAGVSAIASKPPLLTDLFWQVEQLAQQESPTSQVRPERP